MKVALFALMFSLLLTKQVMLAPWVRNVAPPIVTSQMHSAQWEKIAKRLALPKKINLLYFGFMNCPDICPTALQNLAHVLGQLPESERERLSYFFLSVDQKRDLWPATKDYAASFNPLISSLDLDESESRELMKDLGVYSTEVALENSSLNYTIDHSSRFYLINQQGDVLAFFTDRITLEEWKQVMNTFPKDVL